MKRFEILNYLIDKYKYKDYLEIGVQRGECFRNITAENKTGVDPDWNSPATICMTSDDFFRSNTYTYDLIFIDGLHHADQVYKDIQNAIEVLNPGGTIMCHDMLPTSKEAQTIPLTNQSTWMGNCWEAWVKLRQELTNFSMVVINTDCGCGIIREGTNELLNIEGEVNYEGFVKNALEWMNVISTSELVNV